MLRPGSPSRSPRTKLSPMPTRFPSQALPVAPSSAPGLRAAALTVAAGLLWVAQPAEGKGPKGDSPLSRRAVATRALDAGRTAEAYAQLAAGGGVDSAGADALEALAAVEAQPRDEAEAALARFAQARPDHALLPYLRWRLMRRLPSTHPSRQALQAQLSELPIEGKIGAYVYTQSLSAQLRRPQSRLDCEAALPLAEVRPGSGVAGPWRLYGRCLGELSDRRAQREGAALLHAVSTLWPRRAAGRQAKRDLASLRAAGIRPGVASPELLLSQARYLVAQRGPRHARRTLTRMAPLLRDPAATLELTLLRAETALRLRRFREARRLLRATQGRGVPAAQRAHGAFLLAELAARRGRGAEALTQLALRWPGTPHGGLARYKLGVKAQRKGRFEVARVHHEACLAEQGLSEAALRCRWGLAWSWFLEGNYPLAQAALDDLLLAAPPPLSAGTAPIDAPFAQARTALDPRFWQRARYWRARLDELQGRPDEARARFVEAAQDAPYDFFSLLSLEGIARLGGDPAQAITLESEDPHGGARAPHPELRAAAALVDLGLSRRGRALLVGVPRHRQTPADRRQAATLWSQLGHLDRAHRAAPIPWSGGLPAGLHGVHGAHARLAYPRAYQPLVEATASSSDLPPALLYATMRAESAFKADARSPAGALGLTQVIRPTAREIARELGLKRFKFRDLRRPNMALRIGGAYMARLQGYYQGQLPLSVAAYNAGEPSVDRWLRRRGALPLDAFLEEIPYAETHRYARKVLTYYGAYRLLYGAHPTPLGFDPARPADPRLGELPLAIAGQPR